jgi:hypothetical protein
MNPKKVNKIFVEAGIVAALSLIFAGCGQQDQKQGKNVAAEKSTDLEKDQNDKSGTASLGLALPKNLPAEVDQVEVSLSRMIAFDDGCGGLIGNSGLYSKDHHLGRPCFLPGISARPAGAVGLEDIDKKSIAASTHQIFDVNGQPIQINDLDAGDYWITVNLVNSATGRVYSTGEGRATVEAGKLATARISMTKVEDTTGGLIIVLEDALDSNEPSTTVEPAPPLVCPAIAMLPVCVVVGKSLVYQVYDHKRLPNSCEFAPLPQFFQPVPTSHCKGLPGSERLRSDFSW